MSVDSFRRVAALSVVVLAIGACGGTDGDPDDPAVEASPDATAEEPATGEDGTADEPADAEGPSGSGDPAELEELADVIAAAQEEGMLRLNWGGTGLADSVPTLFEGFQEYYGLDLELQHDPQSQMSGNMSTLGAEFEANRAAHTDIAWGVTVHIQQGLRDGWVVPIDDYEDWSVHITEDMVDGYDGEPPLAVAGYTLYGGVVYNTDIVTEELRTPEDILALEHPIASTPIGAMFDRVAGPYENTLTEDEVFEFLEEFEIAGLISCGDIDRVASGEFPVLFIACSQASYHVFAEQGAPVDFRPIEGMNIAQHNYMFFPEHAENPNVARLFANYVSSPEGQQVFRDIVLADNMFAPDSRTGAEIDAWEAEGFDYVFVGLQDLRDLQEATGPDTRDRILGYFDS
jgi:ABC-type glycerol-3-phosphate transport system substrate-binding protein